MSGVSGAGDAVNAAPCAGWAETGLRRDPTLSLLRAHLPELARRFTVKRLALFGSVARDSARDGSDLDLLVEFSAAPTAKDYFGLLFWLEDRFGREIDLVTTDDLRPELRPYVERDRIDVA